MAQLKTYNHLTSDMLNVGQVLRLTPDPNTSNPEVKPSFNGNALIAGRRKYIEVPYQ